MLRPALDSLIRQTHPAIEIIFVDNGSTDKSVVVAEQMLSAQSRPFRIVNCVERGVNKARNYGYPFANGDYVQWMDADDAIDATKIALQVAALEASPGFDVAYGDFTECFSIPNAPRAVRKRKLSQDKDQVFRALSGGWYPPHLYLLRRSAADRLQQAQAWNSDCKVGTDREYSCTAALMGMKFLHVPGAHVFYNIWSEGQISQRTAYGERVRSLEAIFGRLRSFVERTPAAAALTARHRVLLDQDWTIWTLPRGSVSIERLDGRRVRIRQVQTGRTIEMRPREAATVRAIVEAGKAMATSHYALLLTGGSPPVDDPVLVIETMQALRRAGFLVAVERGAGSAASGAATSS